MGFIDYSRIGAPSYGKEIRQAGDDIFEAMRARATDEQKARAQAEEIRHNQALEDYNQQIANATIHRLASADTRDERKFQHEEDDRSLKGVTDAYDALGKDDGSFNAVVAGHNLVDHPTNEYTMPMRPEAPKPVGPEPQPTFVGPVQSLEDAMMQARKDAPPSSENEVVTPEDPEPARAAERARLAAEKVQGQRAAIDTYQSQLADHAVASEKFGQDQKDFVADEAAYPRAQRNFDEHTVHELTLPNGRSAGQMTVADARYASRSKSASDMQDSILPQLNAQMAHAEALHDPVGVAAIQKKINGFNEHVQAVMAGVEKPADAYKAYQAGVSASDLQAGKVDIAKIGGEYSLEKQRIANQRPQISATVAQQGLGLRQEEAGNRKFQQLLKNNGYAGDVTTMKDLFETNHNLGVGNSALDVTAGAQFAKKAQGAGVLTDKDYDRFWGAIGGVNARPENFMDMVMDGKMGEDKRHIVLQAIREKVRTKQQQMGKLAEHADKMFANEPWYPSAREAYFDFEGVPPMGTSKAPRIGTSGATGGGKSKHVSASGSAIPKAGSGDPDLDALKALLE